MKNAIFTGTQDGKFFAFVMPKQRVINLMGLVLEGKDDEFERKLKYMLPCEAAALDAMSWEHEDTINAYINELQNNGRFAVKHDRVEFGVGTNGVDSAVAFNNKEF